MLIRRLLQSIVLLVNANPIVAQSRDVPRQVDLVLGLVNIQTVAVQNDELTVARVMFCLKAAHP